MRPIPAWMLLIAVALALTAADQTIRRTWRPQGDIRYRALAYQRQASAPGPGEVVVFGSCLPEQMMDMARLQASITGDLELFNLGIASGTGLMWTVLLKDYIPQGANVEAILIPFGHTDLSRRDVPWESHLMELASWRDLPAIAEADCDTLDCYFEIGLRKASWLYRHRTFVAGSLWTALGAGRLERTTWHGEYQRQWASIRSEYTDPWRYLKRFLSLARERGVPVILTPLPDRNTLTGSWNPPERQREELRRRDEIIRTYGAHLKAFPEVPGLSAAHFEDDVHLGAEGRRMLTDALAGALPGWLAELRATGDDPSEGAPSESAAPAPATDGDPALAPAR